MILLYAILFICFEAIGEALIKRRYPESFIFNSALQWIISVSLFVIWLFAIALPFDKYYVPDWKLIAGFIFVRFLVFDVVWNVVRGVEWNYYGTKKWYDRTMTKLGSWGWFMKAICGIVGIVFLIGKG